MYGSRLPSAGPSFLFHLVVLVAALLTLPIVWLIDLFRKEEKNANA